jgi:RimJ/RimL family protein N-acetyltransferase
VGCRHLDYGFSHLNLEKISLAVLADDERAVEAYRKAGFVEEGRLRNHTWYDGARHDELVLSVLRQDWAPPFRAGG